MIVYSRKIVQFVQEIKGVVKQVLSKEIGLKVSESRFYDQSGRASYPLQIVVYNNKSMLGYFDPEFYELGFHESLMHAKKELLYNVIRHEIAHYMTFIDYGEVRPHGNDFKAFCKKMKWGEEVYGASLSLEEFAPIEQSSVLRKVQKLMALGTSSNPHEAEQAMIKSQELLLKHNIDEKYVGEDEEKISLKRIMKEKRESAKMRAIGKILETFFVSTVYNRSASFTYLEILGTSTNVEIAEYVASFLQAELEYLWIRAQKQAFLKGTVAKNSFFLGIAKGYSNKIQALKQEYSSEVTKALLVIEKQLALAREMAYPRLFHVKRGGNYCPTSSALGEKMGKSLSINPAINQSTNSAMKFII